MWQHENMEEPARTMKLPLQIAFRNLDWSDAIAAKIGERARFDVEMGERGPQATTVYLVGKHHIVG